MDDILFVLCDGPLIPALLTKTLILPNLFIASSIKQIQIFSSEISPARYEI